MDLDPAKVIEALSRIETQYKAITETLTDIKQNLTLGEVSTLRDSVKVLVGNEMKEQHRQCGNDMRTVAESAANIAVSEHVKAYHKRDSKSPASGGFSWDFIKPALLFLVKRVLPLILAGGATIGGYEALNTTDDAPKNQTVKMDRML
jgi:hypothetical protein